MFCADFSVYAGFLERIVLSEGVPIQRPDDSLLGAYEGYASCGGRSFETVFLRRKPSSIVLF